MRRNPGQSLRFVRTLALLSPLPGCVESGLSEPPPPPGEYSSGGVLVLGNGGARNRNTVVQGNNAGEGNVEMRTVVVGNQQQVAEPACRIYDYTYRPPNLRCNCVATAAGPTWQCRPTAGCDLGDVVFRESGTCTCTSTAGGPDWSCESFAR